MSPHQPPPASTQSNAHIYPRAHTHTPVTPTFTHRRARDGLHAGWSGYGGLAMRETVRTRELPVCACECACVRA